MIKLKFISYLEIKEFTYESREERDKHVESMNKDGWEEDGSIKRLKRGVSLWDAKGNPDNYEYFAKFYRYGDDE